MITFQPVPPDKSRSADSGNLRLLASLESYREKLDRPKKLFTINPDINNRPLELFSNRTVSIASGRGFRYFRKEMNKRRKSQVPPPEPNSAA